MKLSLQTWVKNACFTAVFLPFFNASAADFSPLTIQTKTGTAHFEVEMAVTPEEQAEGLMFRTELAQDRGMLFLFSRPRELSMWMKHTYIPLDMLFIREDSTIMRIAENTTPHSLDVISSGGDAIAALEVPGGTASRIGAAEGDRVEHRSLP